MSLTEHLTDIPLGEGTTLHFEKMILVLAGLPLVGKTTLGNTLAEKSNLTYYDVDWVRQQLFPGTKRRSDAEETVIMRKSYEAKFALAREMLKLERPVALGATYSRAIYTQLLSELAEETRSPLAVLMLQVDDGFIRERLIERQKIGSDSVTNTWDLYLLNKQRYNPTIKVDGFINTSGSIPESLSQILPYLKDFSLPHRM